MHRVPSPTMEDEANAFASALLMPARDVRPYLSGRLTIQRLPAGLVRRAMQLLIEARP